MEVVNLPFVADTLQDKGAPLARGFAAQLKCDDGVSIERLNQQVLRSNGRWTCRAERIGVEDRLERSLDFRTASNSSQRSRRGRWKEYGSVFGKIGTKHRDITIAERDEKISDDAFDVLLRVRLRARHAQRIEGAAQGQGSDQQARRLTVFTNHCERSRQSYGHRVDNVPEGH
jgi:hypothetical protein